MRTPAPLAALALLGACTVGPRYTPPTTPATAQGAFQSSAALGADPTEPPDDWWRLFRDPALDALVTQALGANKDLAVAAANLAEARAVLEQARAGRLPSTGVSSGVNYGRLAGGDRGGTNRVALIYDAVFDASYEVDLYGRVRRSIQAAGQDVEAEQAARDAVTVSVAAETTRAYLDACAFGASVAVGRRSLDVVTQSFGILQVQRGAGAISDYEVVRGQALLAQTRALIPTLEAQRRSALFRLAVLTGRPPAEVSPAAAACARTPEPSTALPVGDGASLLRRRPDIRQAERRLAAATARVGVATADLYPTISLGGAVSTAASTVGGLARGSNIGFSLGPLLNWSFPNLSVARSRVRQAEARTAAALAAFDGTVLNALSETEQALTQYAGQLERREALRAAVASDTDAVNLTNLRYQAGSVPFLDLLDVQRTLVADESALSSADQIIADNRVSVFKALGGGWRSGPEPPAVVGSVPRSR